jgi:shikimate kinase
MRIFLIGYMGSGKTSIGKRIAEKLHLQFIDMDQYIENQLQKSIAEIFDESGEAFFREKERECLHEVAKMENAVIATGGGAPCHFDNIEVMNLNGLTVYIRLSTRQLSDRLKTTNISKRPLLASQKEDELEKYIRENLSKRETFYNKAQLTVSGSDDEIVEQIISFVENSYKK